jgi:hypothetical protein
MPRLRPQKLSGFVVIPTVEHDGLVFTVSLAIDVGSSRTGPGTQPPEIVTREDLIVELRNATDGSFEPIGSPDPGPLPVRALRVVQARGEFTFGQGVNPPDEVVVTVRGDRKSFPMAQTFPTTGGLTAEPQEGDPFATPGKGKVPLPIFPFRPRCCVRRFATPLHVNTDPAAKSEFFEMDASLGAGPGGIFGTLRGCRCSCCEYRQFVRGTFHDSAGDAVLFDLPSGPLAPTEYREDGTIDEFSTQKHGYYGHRDTSTPGDAYSGTGGCMYRANETPSCPPTDGVHLEFLGLIVDVCRGRVTAKRTWVVDL